MEEKLHFEANESTRNLFDVEEYRSPGVTRSMTSRQIFSDILLMDERRLY